MVNAEARAREGTAAESGVGQRFEKVAADDPEQIDLTISRAFDHRHGGPARARRHREPPHPLPSRPRGGIEVRHAADLRSTLYA